MKYDKRAPVVKFCTAVFGFFFFVTCNAAVSDSAEHPWQTRIKKDGITVSTRKVDGSPIIEYQADVIVDASLAQVTALFEDDLKTPLWYYQCVKAESVEKIIPDKKISYVVLHLPFPVAERDAVFQTIRSTDPASGVVTYIQTALPTRLPEHKGKIRVLYLNSIWRFAPQADGRTEMYFRQHSNPGGSIPVFLVNKLSVEIPFYSLKNFRKLVLKTKE
ncbi:MAG: hypothetical protein HQL23_05775 [Candidatus Omnitrophica bacterium]|nr:hypothetical protein [Candidatus Omnitrophota bacterium]